MLNPTYGQINENITKNDLINIETKLDKILNIIENNHKEIKSDIQKNTKGTEEKFGSVNSTIFDMKNQISKEHSEQLNQTAIDEAEELALQFVLFGIALCLSTVAIVSAAKNHGKISELIEKARDTIIESVAGSNTQLEEKQELKQITASAKNMKIPESMKMKKRIDENVQVKEERLDVKKKGEEFKSKINEIYKKIGEEKTSKILREVKLIAIQEKDADVIDWIENELSGYVPNSTKPIKMKKLNKKIPEYRHINSKFDVLMPDQTTETLQYLLWIGHAIQEIENWLDSYEKKPNSIFSIAWTFQEEIKLLKGKTVDLIIPETQVRSIITGVQQKLSNYLESKME